MPVTPISSTQTSTQVTTTVATIISMLAKAGARSIRTDYDVNGVPSGLTFALDTPWGPRDFALPVNTQGLAAALKRLKYPAAAQRPEQVQRTAWRNAHDWLKSQLTMLETGMVTPAEAFFPYLVTGWDDRENAPVTAFDTYTKTQREISS